MTQRTAILLVLIAALGIPIGSEAQVAGTISGYVRDESGGVIPGAEVRATMVGQQLTRSAVTDETGFFNLLAMPRGNYEITAQLTGFATQRTTAELTAGENLRVDFRMNVSQIQETITVSGAAALVETRSATISGLVDDRRVQELPLNGRNVVELASTLPGITDVQASEEMGSTRGGPTMIVHGASRGQNNFTLNGSNFTNYSQTAGFNPPPPDAVQEIRVQTSAFSAEFGNNAGAQVSMVTKAGGNQFHGSAWEFHRNDKLNARSFFAPRKPEQEQNQWGASGGGRIVTNKLFYFGSFQRLTNRAEAVAAQAFVPSDAQRAGNFSGGAAIRNPVDPITNRPYTDASGAACVSANIINPSCISPVAKAYLERFIPRSDSGTVVKLQPSPLDAYNWVTRFDYTASSKNTLYGHYFKDNYERTTSPGNLNYVDQSDVADFKQWGITDTHTFSPTFLNEATVSFMDASSFRTATDRVPPRDMGINVDEGYLGVGMSLNVTGQFNLSFTGPERQVYRNWHWRDTMTLVRSAHTFKWGYEGQHVNFDLIRGNGARSATFTGTRSGSAMADFMLGAFDQVSYGFGAADSFPLLWKHQFFIQDEWKLTPRITMNLGLRYEPWFPWEQEFGRYTSWELGKQSTVKPDAPRGILFPGDPGVPDKTVENDLNNFAPRVGMAWDMNGDGRTVLRGGYGIYYNHISGTSVHAAEAPWTGTVQLRNGRIEDPFGSLNVRTLPPSGVPISGEFGCVQTGQYPGLNCPLYPLPLNFVYNDLEMATPTVHHLNTSFQRQLTNDLMVDVAYVGRFGYKLEGHRHFNPAQFINSPRTGLAPSTQNINERVLYEPGIIGPTSRVLETRYRSWYNGLELKATRRMSRGFMFSGFYTLSKALDELLDQGAGLTAGVSNPFDLSTMKGRSQFDRRHVVGLSWMWEQSRQFDNRAMNALLSGWTVSGVHNWSSGNPLNFTMGTDVALDGTNSAGRQLAQLAGGATVDDIKRDHQNRDDFIGAFFNASAFAPVSSLPRGIYGNVPKSAISGPAQTRSDIAVTRSFRLPGREGMRFQFRGELFNAFNQVNFNAPSTNASAATFGRITSADAGRIGQVALKLLW